MLDVSGHLRDKRKFTGFLDTGHPVLVNCSGWQILKTKDLFLRRAGGRLDYQLIYLYRGAGHFFLQDSWVDLTAGNLILYRPYEPQIYSFYAEEKPEVFWIHFTGKDCDSILEKYRIENCYIGENLSLRVLFQDIITELQLKKYLYEDIVTNNFYKMLATICRSRQQFLIPLENNFSIDRLIVQINQHYMDKWTVSSMADYCKLSKGYFAHAFQNRMKVSPMHYLINLRIEKAKDLLAADTMNISAIAPLVGFDDPLYFSRAFKKAVGVTPRDFRQSVLESNTPEI